MFKPVIYLTKSDLACSPDRTTCFEFIPTNIHEFFNQSDKVLFVHLIVFFVKSILYWLKINSQEVQFHRITLSYSYFEEFEFLRQISKKQNMIKKTYQLNRNEKT